jgi:UDP:flavonoid glycosyltransferase YjiC (YdhE family)
MAHILLGWELGGNRGHAVALMNAAEALRVQGHRVSFALQQVDSIGPEQSKGSAVWQAPVTPRLLSGSAQRAVGDPASMGDILARLGLNDAGIVAAMIRSWHLILDEVSPDLVVANFAPFLLLAARGRCPTISMGTGFTTPPSAMSNFPNLSGAKLAVAEETTLAAVNDGLRGTGCGEIERLPQVFAASLELAATFSELDPYSQWRTQAPIMPSIASDADAAAGGGDEIFVYAHQIVRANSPFWQGLAASGVPVRAFVAGAGERYRAEIARLGLQVESAPVPFARVAQQSRMIVSHGGHGTICSAMLAGLPQIVCHYDLEKKLNGRAVTQAGLGVLAPLVALKPELFAAAAAQMHADEALAARARAVAKDLRARYSKTMPESVAGAVNELL